MKKKIIGQRVPLADRILLLGQNNPDRTLLEIRNFVAAEISLEEGLGFTLNEETLEIKGNPEALSKVYARIDRALNSVRFGRISVDTKEPDWRLDDMGELLGETQDRIVALFMAGENKAMSIGEIRKGILKGEKDFRYAIHQAIRPVRDLYMVKQGLLIVLEVDNPGKIRKKKLYKLSDTYYNARMKREEERDQAEKAAAAQRISSADLSSRGEEEEEEEEEEV